MRVVAGPAAGRVRDAGADVDAKDETEQSAYLITTSEGHLPPTVGMRRSAAV